VLPLGLLPLLRLWLPVVRLSVVRLSRVLRTWLCIFTRGVWRRHSNSGRAEGRASLRRWLVRRRCRRLRWYVPATGRRARTARNRGAHSRPTAARLRCERDTRPDAAP